MAAAGFGLACVLPFRDGITDAIWRGQIPADLQGRVFALLQIVGSLAFGLAYILIGPLADGLFEPWLAVDGPLAGSVGQLIGVGDGRGMALCVILAGLLTLTTTIIAALNPHIRALDEPIQKELTKP